MIFNMFGSGGDDSTLVMLIDGSITALTIPEGVTSVRKFAFHNCAALKSVTVPETVEAIGEAAFARCESLERVNLPNTITAIEGDTFYECSSLTSLQLPDSLESVGSSAFRATGIGSLVFPASLKTLDSMIAMGSNALTTVTFKGTPTTIHSNAFYACSGLTTIYVPWSEGEVDNAPWGATNATIHYNSTTEG